MARSGAALAGWGLAEAIAVDRMAQVLAEPGGQRRALLVGINAYQPATIARLATDVALEGCLTDVALLQEVLVSRLGFGAADVVTLTDRTASRSNWQAALEDLYGSVRASDAVVFHFSGYGSQLADGTSVLVPVDGQLVQDPDAIGRDWSEDTLQDWLRSLPTERAIGIVDAGSAVALPSLWLRQRSRPALTPGRLDPAELAWRQTLQRNRSGRSSLATGLWLRATTADRPAVELPQAGFVAGAFTYALVQRLWNALPARTLWFDLAIAAATVENQMGTRQRPIGQRLGAAANDPQPGQWLNPDASPGCGAIVASDPAANTVEVTLAGLGPTVLEAVAAGTVLETIDQPAIGLRVLTRTGWQAIAQPIADDPPGRAIDWTTLQPGQLLRERWRVLPRNLELNVALDPTFERIERIDATSAFDALSQVAVITPGTRPIDVWFGRSTRPAAPATAIDQSRSAQASLPTEPKPDARPDSKADAKADLPRADLPKTDLNLKTAYGLLTPGQTLWPSTVGDRGEALKTTVQRLTPPLYGRLAHKVLRATLNGGGPWPVRATLATLEAPDRPLLRVSTAAMAPDSTIAPSHPIAAATLASRSRPQLTLENAGAVPLAFLVLQLDGVGHAAVVIDGTAMTIPPNGRRSLNWAVAVSRGMGSVLVWLTPTLLDRTQAALPPFEEGDQLVSLPQPLVVARALLEDLQQRSGRPSNPRDRPAPTDHYALDCQQWIGLELPFRVVEAARPGL